MSKLPTGWKRQTLEDVAEVIMGQSPPGSSYNESGKGTPFFQGKAEFGEVYPTVKKYTTAGTKFAKQGDILMSVRAPVGPTNIAGINCVIGRGLAAIRAKDSITQDYLKWTLKHLEIEIQGKGKGTTFDSISGDALRETVVTIPPIAEQHQIVEILEDHLSRLDAALADIKQVRFKATQFRSALLNEAFVGEKSSTWKTLTFRELGKWITGSTPSSKNKDFVGTEVPFVTPGDIADGGKILTVARRISKRGADVVRVVSPPSIQLVCIGATLGKVGLSNSAVTTNQQINSLEPDTSVVLPEFAMWLLASAKYQENLWFASSSTTVPILNKGNLEKISVLLPDVSRQEEILQTLELNLSQITQILNTLDSLENQSRSFRRSLLQAAFTGQLTREATHV